MKANKIIIEMIIHYGKEFCIDVAKQYDDGETINEIAAVFKSLKGMKAVKQAFKVIKAGQYLGTVNYHQRQALNAIDGHDPQYLVTIKFNGSNELCKSKYLSISTDQFIKIVNALEG